MAKLNVEKTDYSKIAERYDKVRPPPSDILVSKIIDFGKITDECSVLDVGCGTGRYPLAINNSKNCVICALDPSVEMLDKATQKDESNDIMWIRGDGQHLPFRRGIFDCIYMTMVIQHIEDKKKAIQEIKYILKPRGRCVILTGSHIRLRNQVLRGFRGFIDLDVKRFPTIPYLRKTMRGAGYSVIHHYPIEHNEYQQTDEFLEKVRNKYVSTLTLLSDDVFQRRYKVFEGKIRKKYDSQILVYSGCDFVVGEK
jgi:SAM-dependent methyltransferase